MNTTTPIDDNGDDSFDWHEMSDEEWEECVRGALSDEQMYPRDPYLQGGHYEDPNQMYDE